MTRFLIGAQLPPALALRLRQAGHPADHVNEVGWGAATDDEIAQRASPTGAVVVTEDADFATLGRRSAALHVVWIRVGSTTSRELWRRLEPKLPAVVAVLEGGETLIEPR